MYLGPGAQAGGIVAWKQGLPGWTHALQQDGIATIADDLRGAFAELCLEEDPEDPDSTGIRVLEYRDERVADHGMPQALADKLTAFYRRALVDWRGPLAAGTLAQSPRLANLALRHALVNDDGALVAQLAAQEMCIRDSKSSRRAVSDSTCSVNCVPTRSSRSADDDTSASTALRCSAEAWLTASSSVASVSSRRDVYKRQRHASHAPPAVVDWRHPHRKGAAMRGSSWTR